MRTVLTAMPAYLRLSLANMFQYRGEIVLWAVWGIVYPAVAIAMWTAAIAGKRDGSDIAGFGAREFAAYFLLTMIVGHFTTAWDIYEMGHLVRRGLLSPQLLLPLLPIWKRLADNFAYKILTFAVLVPIWLIVAWITEPAFATTTQHVLLGTAATFLGAMLMFLWGYALATVAFWITRTDAVAEGWFLLSLVFGGRLAPLSVLPSYLQTAAAVLPFKWMIWFPSESLMGRVPLAEVAWGILWQLCWMVGGLIAFRVAWRAGLRRYSAVGA